MKNPLWNLRNLRDFWPFIATLMVGRVNRYRPWILVLRQAYLYAGDHSYSADNRARLLPSQQDVQSRSNWRLVKDQDIGVASASI
jgi:hypothetical protein